MSEAGEMWQELQRWIELLEQLQTLAIEMDSHEQDADYLSEQIYDLLDGQEDDYNLTFHDSRSPKKMRLHISWSVVPFDQVEFPSDC